MHHAYIANWDFIFALNIYWFNLLKTNLSSALTNFQSASFSFPVLSLHSDMLAMLRHRGDESCRPEIRTALVWSAANPFTRQTVDKTPFLAHYLVLLHGKCRTVKKLHTYTSSCQLLTSLQAAVSPILGIGKQKARSRCSACSPVLPRDFSAWEGSVKQTSLAQVPRKNHSWLEGCFPSSTVFFTTLKSKHDCICHF